MSDRKTILDGVLEAIIAGDRERATELFSAYAVESVKAKIDEADFGSFQAQPGRQRTTPQAPNRRTGPQPSPQTQPDEFGFSGKAFIFDDQLNQIAVVPYTVAQRAVNRLKSRGPVRSQGYEELRDYADINSNNDNGNDESHRSLASFLANLEGFDVQIYELAETGGGYGIPENAFTVIIVPPQQAASAA